MAGIWWVEAEVLLDTHRARARERRSESPVPAAEGRPAVLGADYSEHRGLGGQWKFHPLHWGAGLRMCTPVRTHTEPLKWGCFTVRKIYLNNVVLQTKPVRRTEVTKVVVNAEQDGGYSRNNQERAGVVFSEGQKQGDPGPGLFFNKPFATREFCNHSCSCFGNSPTEHAEYSGLPCAAPPLATPCARDPGTCKAKGQLRSNPGSLLTWQARPEP